MIEYFPLEGRYDVIASDSIFDVTEFSYSTLSHMMTAIKKNKIKKENYFRDEEREIIWKKVSEKALSEDLFFMGTDQEENTFLLKSFPSNHPGIYYLYQNGIT